MSVPVSRRAILARANRALAKQDEFLRVARSEKACMEVGKYYVVDLQTNCYLWGIDSVEGLADELKLLKPWEQCADDCGE